MISCPNVYCFTLTLKGICHFAAHFPKFGEILHNSGMITLFWGVDSDGVSVHECSLIENVITNSKGGWVGGVA